MANKNTMNLQQWFSEVATVLELHHDINHPSNREYDYIAAYYNGVNVPKPGDSLPSEFKGDLHANRYIAFDEEGGEYYDSKNNRTVGVQEVMVQEVRRQNSRDSFLETEAE
tara:strand:+ start:645 stop:977 length:333 start_codon:yes stop_codon:yes gene_type:complete